MATAILRIIPRPTLDVRLLAHCAAEGKRPDHADPDAENRVYRDERGKARRRLDALLKAREGRPGRKPNQALDIVFGGPPNHGAQDAWTPEQCEHWARDSIEWYERTFPSSTVSIAALHMDESSPHVHLVAIPEHAGELNWNKLQSAATGKRGRARYRALQDSYHDAVKHYGLERGDRGSKRKHRKLTAEAGRRAAERNITGKLERQRRRAASESARIDTQMRQDGARAIRAERAADDAEYAAEEAEARQREAEQSAEFAERQAADAERRQRDAEDAAEAALREQRKTRRETRTLADRAAAALKQVRAAIAAGKKQLARLNAAIVEAQGTLASMKSAIAEAKLDLDSILQRRDTARREAQQDRDRRRLGRTPWGEWSDDGPLR